MKNQAGLERERERERERELIFSYQKIIKTCDERNDANLKLIEELKNDRDRWKSLYEEYIKNRGI